MGQCTTVAILVAILIFVCYGLPKVSTFFGRKEGACNNLPNDAAKWACNLGILGLGDSRSNIQQELNKYRHWGCHQGDCGNTGGAPVPPPHKLTGASLHPTGFGPAIHITPEQKKAADDYVKKANQNWSKCVDMYAKTCDPETHWSPPDFYDTPMYNSDGSIYSCTQTYQSDQSKRDAFNKGYYGRTDIYDDDGNVDVVPKGPLYKKYCAAPSPPSTNPWQSECDQKCSGPNPYDDNSNPNARACRVYCRDWKPTSFDDEIANLKKYEQKAYGIDPKQWDNPYIGKGGTWSPMPLNADNNPGILHTTGFGYWGDN